ncbi:hypothetical protein M3Y97_00554700 [Aphelenchoides bicaudatus]|nr:hypothetical protein M3Y97_00554700 [Aphelenchoides bicaudatus]
MSNNRFRSQNHHLSNAQPVQQQMPYNDYYNKHLYAQANPNAIYSRPMATYGGLNNDNGANNGAYPPRRFFNPHAPVFEPREPRYVQQQQPTAPQYASAYSTYIQQPIGAQLQQQFRNLNQVYAPAQPINLQLQQTPIQHQQQIHNVNKYHNVPMSQTSQPAYGINDHSQMMYGQNDDYQQQQQLGQQNEFQQFPISNELTSSIQNSTNRMAIVEVQIGLEQMSESPQEYELWSTAIKSRVAAGVSKEDAQLIAWLIVEMSYQNGGDNAQYSFARLCRLLDHEIKSFTTQLVIPRIAYFMASGGVETLSVEHLSNFIVFLAELYDKTEVNGVRISRLGQYIIDQISVQLNGDTLNDQIVKSAVQVLKLTGRYIEEDQDPARLNSLFEQLDKLQNCPTLSSAVKNNIRQLKLLREREWGVTKSDDFMNGSSMNGSYNQAAQNEVLYGPDGVPISEEELMFLQESCREVSVSL